MLEGGSKNRDGAELTTKQLRRGVHRSVPALEAAIREFIEAHNTVAAWRFSR